MLKPQNNNILNIGADGVAELQNLHTQFDIFRFLKKVTESWGMKAFMVLNIPTQMAQALSECTIITNWPSELLQQYDHEGLLTTSTVFKSLKKTSTPFLVDDAFLLRGRDPETVRPMMELFRRFDIAASVWCPLQDANGVRGAVAMSGLRSSFSAVEMAEIYYIAAHVFARLAHIRSLDARPSDTLTDRETDCLNWTAAGKTSAEIADILLLSEHTVNHYLNRATKKLDAVNRTQAVANALRIGLIK